MVRERFGTFRPKGEIGTPAVLFVPLLAFDRTGHRLGYGGGYYDRTLAALPGARAIGCAFAAQELDAVPAGAHDMRLEAVATERGLIRFKDAECAFSSSATWSGAPAATRSPPRCRSLRDTLRVDLVVVNAENASHGFGLAPDMARELFAAGADAITLGNHAWDRKELIPYIAETPRLIRPLNFPPGTPGAGSVVVELADGRRALVLKAMGRLYHGRARLPVPRRGRRTREAPARRPPSPPSWSISTPRRPARKWRSAIRSTARRAWSSARTRIARQPTTRSCLAAPPYQRCRHVRRL